MVTFLSVLVELSKGHEYCVPSTQGTVDKDGVGSFKHRRSCHCILLTLFFPLNCVLVCAQNTEGLQGPREAGAWQDKMVGGCL